jgi:hypothetical protein
MNLFPDSFNQTQKIPKKHGKISYTKKTKIHKSILLNCKKSYLHYPFNQTQILIWIIFLYQAETRINSPVQGTDQNNKQTVPTSPNNSGSTPTTPTPSRSTQVSYRASGIYAGTNFQPLAQPSIVVPVGSPLQRIRNGFNGQGPMQDNNPLQSSYMHPEMGINHSRGFMIQAPTIAQTAAETYVKKLLLEHFNRTSSSECPRDTSLALLKKQISASQQYIEALKRIQARAKAKGTALESNPYGYSNQYIPPTLGSHFSSAYPGHYPVGPLVKHTLSAEMANSLMRQTKGELVAPTPEEENFEFYHDPKSGDIDLEKRIEITMKRCEAISKRLRCALEKHLQPFLEESIKVFFYYF